MKKRQNFRHPRHGSNRAVCRNGFMHSLAGVILGACMAAVSTSVAATGGANEEPATIRTEVIESLSTKEVWHSHRASSFRSQRTVFVVYRASNYENEPIDGEWTSPGFVMFGLGDIDEKPVTIRIWTKGEDRFLEDLSRKETEGGEDGVALFGPSEDDVRLRITAKPHAEVLVNGRSVAWIDDFYEGGQTGIDP